MIKQIFKRLQRDDSRMVMSYEKLRTLIGLLGCLLPVILILRFIPSCDDAEVLGSISAYYHTVSRDWFVGIIFVLAFFLYAYNGYDWKDVLTSRIASISAIFVALFPTSVDHSICDFDIHNPSQLVSSLHYLSAAIFFGALIFFAWGLFTKSNKEQSDMTPQKRQRNVVYKLCATVMTISVILIGVKAIVCPEIDDCRLNHYDPVFWLEVIALEAFGISWLTKAEIIFPDKD